MGILLLVGTCLSLGAWIMLQAQKTKAVFAMRFFYAFMSAFLIHRFVGVSMYSQPVWPIITDLFLIAISGITFAFLATRPKAWVAFPVLALAIWGYWQVKFKLLQPTPGISTEYELLVEVSTPEGHRALQQLCEQENMRMQLAFFPASPEITTLDDYFVVDVPFGKSWQTILGELEKTPGISWVEPNEIMQVTPQENPIVSRTPNAPTTMNDPRISQQWALESIRMSDVYTWIQESGNKPPAHQSLIAILDTGVDGNHEDLKGNFISKDPSSNTDPVGHGTHCAGIAAAVTNNGIGIASAAFGNRIKVTSIRVLGSTGGGTQQSIIKGMMKAADLGADVISMSLGGRSTQTSERAYQKAVEYAQAKGAIVVAAAGNSNKDANEFAPVRVKGVLGVSAIDQNKNKATFSNTVDNIAMKVAAPGVGIISTIPGNKYQAFNGTSMATPYVASVVALLRSVNPKLSTEEVYQILHETGVETNNTRQTGRLIQPGAALQRVAPE